MKEETKELIKWAMAHLADYKTKLLKHEVENVNEDAEKEMCKKFAEFLNSLPEIESHLCRGGYIQDKNGTPCCDGDKVMYKNREYTLQWSRPYSRFFLKTDKSIKDVWKFGIIEISKVEK